MARRLHVSARDMPGEIAGPQSRAQARARRHVARMVVTFVLGNQIHVSFTHLIYTENSWVNNKTKIYFVV